MSRWQPFDPAGHHLPAEPACYAIYADGELVYVGSTNNLGRRMAGHRIRYARYSAYIETPWGSFREVNGKWRASQQLGDWLMHEARLIHRLRPMHNRLQPGMRA